MLRSIAAMRHGGVAGAAAMAVCDPAVEALASLVCAVDTATRSAAVDRWDLARRWQPPPSAHRGIHCDDRRG